MSSTEVMVNVFCDDASHPTRRARLETFVRKRPGAAWALLPVNGRDDRGMNQWSQSALAGDDLVKTGPGSQLSAVELDRMNLRFRYTIECPLCERPLQVRSEKVAVILDAIADHLGGSGSFDLSLGALAARVTSK